VTLRLVVRFFPDEVEGLRLVVRFLGDRRFLPSLEDSDAVSIFVFYILTQKLKKFLKNN
jgi:hypothetical protein